MMEPHKHTNKLINETSPYLLQHAHNPVDWHAWGDEAFGEARRLNKPVLLSIGYSACHWCHVMEHESFENEAIAKLMNDNFVNIKVDREERPDLDNIYMNAVQMLTGHGGWPMTMFLTPDGLPFFGGTYYPPEDRNNMPGFRRVLTGIAEAYHQRPDDVAETANALLSQLQKTSETRESTETLTADILELAYKSIVRTYDHVNGGFGGAPKFPAPMSLEFLLRAFHRTGETAALDMVDRSCRKMASGGIYDQLGGGFHRYSTDANWLVPHFEKMLYDNAQLVPVYLHLFQITGDEFFKRVATGTLDYVVREMTDPSGGFYSTQDADSEGHEGKFFVWNEDEIRQILSKSEADVVITYFGVSKHGNFEGSNILNVTDSTESVARTLGIAPDDVVSSLNRGRAILFKAREHRVKPDRDEKTLTSWNGLMISAFAEAAAILGNQEYQDVAVKAADFCLTNLRHNGLLLRTFKDGQAKLNAYLEDYSFLASGLLTLFEVSGDRQWLDACTEIVDKMIEEFWDNKQGGFFFTGASHETLIVRSKDYMDNATPSGNSVAADVMVRLAVLTGNDNYRRRSVTAFRLLNDQMRRYPSAFGRLLCALDFYLSAPKEIAVVGNRAQDSTRALLRAVWTGYLPNKIVVGYDGVDKAAVAGIPLLEGRGLIDGKPAAYVCENFTCKFPVTDAAELREQLRREP